MSTWLVAPSEPPLLRALGIVSPTIEPQFGADFARPTVNGLCGVQRKEISDLLHSASGGRLARQLNLLRERCAVAILLVEGEPKWTGEGGLLDAPGWTVQGFRGLLLSAQARGIIVTHTHDLADTARELPHLAKWLDKPEHKTLSAQPNARGAFDLPATRDERLAYVLQSMLPGLGPVRSLAIIRHYNGLPLSWKTDVIELRKVSGVGPKTAQRLMEAL